MLKLPDNLSINPGVIPVSKLTPALPVDTIGSTLQELNARATQFVKGQEYSAQVLSRIDNKTYLVKVDNAVLKMELGTAAQMGQTLSLRFMHETPVPTFFLSSALTKPTENAAELSAAAKLIGQHLKQAAHDGVSTRYQAAAIVTQSPTNPHIFAQDLKQSISNSGLFYESHLGEMVKGQRTLAAILQEPQNQNNTQINTLMVQQLSMLESHRLSWHGEVWAGQNMDWDVYLPEHSNADEAVESADENRSIVSEITLHLPNLGKVTAKLNLADGRIRLNILAEQAPTLATLKSQSESLTHAFVNSGLQLDVLTMAQDENNKI